VITSVELWPIVEARLKCIAHPMPGLLSAEKPNRRRLHAPQQNDGNVNHFSFMALKISRSALLFRQKIKLSY